MSALAAQIPGRAEMTELRALWISGFEQSEGVPPPPKLTAKLCGIAQGLMAKGHDPAVLGRAIQQLVRRSKGYAPELLGCIVEELETQDEVARAKAAKVALQAQDAERRQKEVERRVLLEASPGPASPVVDMTVAGSHLRRVLAALRSSDATEVAQ